MDDLAPGDHVDAVDRYIGGLYRAALSVPSDCFRPWALNELKSVLPFDGALWGSGSVSRMRFHICSVVGVPEDYPAALQASSHINPIVPALLSNLDTPVDMSSVMPDREFYKSDLYRKTFKPYGISRILATGHVDRRSGLYSLVSLYRFDRGQTFSGDERACQQRIMFHLFNASSHAFFLNMSRACSERPAESAAAAVDCEGVFHEAMPRFTELLDRYFPGRAAHSLPFELPAEGTTTVHNGLCVRTEPLADLLSVFIWPAGPLDSLTAREREIVYAIAHGLSFKQVAKRIGVAPSTVANHLYRVYRKLGVYSRSALAGLVYPGLHEP